jgi:hypothetical protein
VGVANRVNRKSELRRHEDEDSFDLFGPFEARDGWGGYRRAPTACRAVVARRSQEEAAVVAMVVVVVAVTSELQALATAIAGARRAQRGDITESYAAGRSTEDVRSGCQNAPLGERAGMSHEQRQGNQPAWTKPAGSSDPSQRAPEMVR